MTNAAIDQGGYNYCALPLAPYACRPDQARGRVHEEEESEFRTCFQRDHDRIIHAGAFRRLKYKTQVFVYHTGDNYRTRLTHTLEVAQVSRTIARALFVNEDLAEAIALSHDMGHTPFAHIGENTLSECMAEYGGFDHNDQSLRIVTTLERKYPKFQGMNLSWETLEGIVKHNGPVKDVTESIAALQDQADMQLDSYASVEAQIAGLSDDIAYNSHDVEDGLAAGLFSLDDIQNVPFLHEARQHFSKKYKDHADDKELMSAGVVRYVIGAMVSDVINEAKKRLADANPQSADDVRALDRPVVSFSKDMEKKVSELRDFLWHRMYRHSSVNRMNMKIKTIITDLYNAYINDDGIFNDDWQAKVKEAGGKENKEAYARIVADYIGGMTDRYAINEHARLFELYRGHR